MKRFIVILAVAIVGVVSLSAFTSADSVVNPISGIVSTSLDKAVKAGFRTTEQVNAIKDSKIVELTYQEFMKTGDPAKAIDKAAEIAVDEGWFKSKAAAKAYLKSNLESLRTDRNAVNKVYSLLGI